MAGVTRSGDREELLARPSERGPPPSPRRRRGICLWFAQTEGFLGHPNIDLFLFCSISVPILRRSPKRDQNNNDDDNK